MNNLVCGTVSIEPVIERPTPYHVPHSTQVAGYAATLAGDDRLIGNILLGGETNQAYGPTKRPNQIVGYGTAGYDGHPASLHDYLTQVDDPSKGDHERHAGVKQPVYIGDNAYAGNANAYENESGAIQLLDPVIITISDDGDSIYLDASSRSPSTPPA